jgi:hypothetical protein
MAITAFEMEFSGGTLEQYEVVIAKMGFERHGKGAEEALFHWVTLTDDGIKVVDVWNSPEAFQAFADSQIGPITAEVGMSEPVITSHLVHNYLTAG